MRYRLARPLQEQINNIWAVINELKSLITCPMETPLTTEESIIEVNEARSTERNDEPSTPKKKLITDYFKPEGYANIRKKEKQMAKTLNKKIIELETEVANLKKENNIDYENNQLKTELYHIKQENKPKKDQINCKPAKTKLLEKTSNEKSKNIMDNLNPAQANAKAEMLEEKEKKDNSLIIVAGDSIVNPILPGLLNTLQTRRGGRILPPS